MRLSEILKGVNVKNDYADKEVVNLSASRARLSTATALRRKCLKRAPRQLFAKEI